MKIRRIKEYSVNKYKVAIFLVGIILLNILAVFVMPFFVFKIKYGINMPWYYIAASLISLVLIFVFGFNLDNCYLKACNKIKRYSKKIEYKNVALVHMYNKLKTSKENLDKFSEELEEKVFEKTESIQNLLNNAGQGFLSFGSDLKVDKDYSLECKKIFNQQIHGQSISRLIFPNDEEMQELIRNVTHQVLDKKSDSKRELYLSLLPNEAYIDKKQIQIEYKIIRKSIYTETEAIMLILTDITDKRKLQEQMENERNILKMVVNIVTNYSDFIYCLNDYENFCNKQMFDIINTSYSAEDIITKIYRAIHTFKGNFGQFGLNNATYNLHQFEYELSELLKNTNNMSLENLEFNLSKNNLYQWVDEDINILKNILGDSFFRNKDVLEIDKKNFIKIENKLLSLLSPLDRNLILPEINKFRYKPLKELLKSYTNYILGLSDRFNKQLNPLEIVGGDFLVDPDRYRPFTKSLGHVFRDIIEYGIETWEERINEGKSGLGNIKCTAKLINGTIELKIADDGHGIDIDLIRKTAVEKGYYTLEEVNNKKNNEIISLIFFDGFSTSSEISNLSGRGMGLSAVKDEVDKLGGSIEVNTLQNSGTTFTFTIPFIESNNLPLISEDKLMNSLVDTTKNFFSGQILLCSVDIENKVKKVENLILRDISVLISIKGAINGIFIFTADKNLLEIILSYFDLQPSDSEEEEIRTEDVLAECANMIMGNLSNSIPHIENYINLGVPIAYTSQKSQVIHENTQIWTSILESVDGNLEINYINF